MEQYQRQQAATDVKDDPEARAVLRQAFEKTARWPRDFKGFTADLEINLNGNTMRGSVTVKGPREVQVSLPDPDVQRMVESQIGMIAVHRGFRSFDESDGKFALTLGDDAHHPLGRSLFIHGDGMHSFYRIKNDRITQINRKMQHGEKMPPIAFTINVEDSATTADGRYLTTHYTVYYSNGQDGRLTNVESFTDTHTRIGACDLPKTRRIIGYEKGTVVARTFTFSNHKLL